MNKIVKSIASGIVAAAALIMPNSLSASTQQQNIQKNTPLILQHASAATAINLDHGSHDSHGSHTSHYSSRA
jgi:hypothetical protein